MILPSADLASVSLGAGAALAYAATALASPRLSPATIRRLLVLAWLIHAMAIAWALMASPPRFGFGPALSVTVWLVATVYAIEIIYYPQLQTQWTLSALGAVAVLLALVFPGGQLHASASLWLPLHWALGIASYGLFGVAVAHGWFMTRAEGRIRVADNPDSGLPLLTLERLTFRFVGAGFVLLSATLAVALLFGDQLYGVRTGWKWDHKTVFSLLSWLTFAVLLLGRRLFGWRGQVAVRVLYIGAGLLLMAYVGSRFVLEVILRRSL